MAMNIDDQAQRQFAGFRVDCVSVASLLRHAKRVGTISMLHVANWLVE
jgi:hypothetical protein